MKDKRTDVRLYFGYTAGWLLLSFVGFFFFSSAGHEERAQGTAVITNILSVSTPQRLLSKAAELRSSRGLEWG